MRTFSHIFEHWHFWTGTQFMASDEWSKQLLAFDDIDACINWLFVSGHRRAARSLNAAKRVAA